MYIDGIRTMKIIDGIPVYGEPLQNAIDQMKNCLRKDAFKGALMADHHLGYAVPVGGVIAYEGLVSPSGVGFDIACGNKAVRLDGTVDFIGSISKIMNDVWSQISFGVGRKNKTPIDHPLFDDPAWEIPVAKALKEMAREQLGTVGSGNHYVDIFRDSQNRIWIGCHFGSRGLGHKLASHFIKAAGGKDGINVDPCVIPVDSQLGQEYIACMNLAGRYAYAGRDWVCDTVAKIIGCQIVEQVHNHHNFAWEEEHFGRKLWVIRKGATPAAPGQRGFVGGTMGEPSVILEGTDHPESELTLRSTVHGAGRVLSRSEAAGKRKWINGVPTRVSAGKVSSEMMNEWIARKGIELRGAGVDESPHCYKRLSEVIEAQGPTVRIIETLHPMGVAMAGEGEIDPYKD